MSQSRAAIRQRLREFDFRHLFIEELGWDIHRGTFEVSVDGRSYTLRAVAEKHGMAVYVCEVVDGLPDDATKRRIEREAAKLTTEKLIVFTNSAKTEQVWQWVKKEPGRPAAYREHAFKLGQKEELLVQKLDAIAFDIEEAERVRSVAEVAERVGSAFDVDRVTKRFYDRFKTEHQAFLGFIKGISAVADREWYASLMLNRLMFIYFFQRQGFLDGDDHYLRNRLRRIQERGGAGQFLSFYRYFLRRLFHEGLGRPVAARDADLDVLLGAVPYLNGGLFDVHQLEQGYPDIDIPDAAFVRVFDFFDAWDWHLDERPLGNDRDINPDVLGYIFEKYVNQKQMGAYYTKEDVTEYIARNTVVPFLLDAAEKKCSIAFRENGEVWRLLREDPDRYIHRAVRHGVDLPLPAEIALGIADTSARDRWNRQAPDEYALPTETWREHVRRRERCAVLRRQLGSGELHSVDELVTLNLDVRRFVQDVIENAEGPELVRAFWHSLAGHIPDTEDEVWQQGLSVLDPTCGSGAFLFAALNVLLPIYEACLQRMKRFVDEVDLADPERSAGRFPDFRRTLAQMAQHANPRYFMVKSIILENLYGVDLMEEAVEICKLRLFLKLVAQLDSADQIEPLPDIDFNVRAGNTLVGFASRAQVREALTVGARGQMLLDATIEDQALRRIDELAEAANRAYKQFRRQQTEIGGAASAAVKSDLSQRLRTLGNELDQLLARQYGIQSSKTRAYDAWRASHQPFHWFVDFYGLMDSRGFDVVLGNPPYVEYAKVRGSYTIRAFSTEECGNLYGFTIERSLSLLSAAGRMGMIVPLSTFSTQRMLVVWTAIKSKAPARWVANFGWRPAKLFDGVNLRLSIILAAAGTRVDGRTYSTKCLSEKRHEPCVSHPAGGRTR